jgi:quercetin dioxygenase-like cupin family protein
MFAQQIFTEEEHAIMGALRMHSLDVQTHAPGVVLPVHRNPEEFAYILRGTGEVMSGDDWVKVRPGSLVYTEEAVQHAVKNTSEDLPFQYVAFEFTRQDESWTEMGHREKT